jgi:hypothetical protein
LAAANSGRRADVRAMPIAVIGSVLIALVWPPLCAPAWSHDVAGNYWQYAQLPDALAKRLRANRARRDAAQVRAYFEQRRFNTEKRKTIIRRFGLGGSGPNSFEQIYIRNTLWPTGHRFRICFFDGNAAARRHVLDLFEAIVRYTSLKVDRTDRQCPDSKADVQIKFDETGCYSYVGKEALEVIKESAKLPTMGLCGLAGPSWDERDDGIIRHELMHALGAAHEHQHPDSKCKDEINLEAFRHPPFFDADPAENENAITVNIEDITKSYPRDQLEIVQYDPKSIMHYRLDAKFFKTPNATCALTADNNFLSAADWLFLRKMYPVQ